MTPRGEVWVSVKESQIPVLPVFSSPANSSGDFARYILNYNEQTVFSWWDTLWNSSLFSSLVNSFFVASWENIPRWVKLLPSSTANSWHCQLIALHSNPYNSFQWNLEAADPELCDFLPKSPHLKICNVWTRACCLLLVTFSFLRFKCRQLQDSTALVLAVLLLSTSQLVLVLC